MTSTADQVPTYGSSAFACPHCKALAQQRWMRTYVRKMEVGEGPSMPDPARAAEAIAAVEDQEQAERLRSLVDALTQPYPFVRTETNDVWTRLYLPNVFLSECFVCSKTAVWLTGQLIWPPITFVVEPNEDLPPHVRADFEEAAAIFTQSPRGAAALLRLAIEKLCIHLGKSGTIDEMIADLVADGLNEKIQKALDVVRVIGNEGVHPGVLDLRDDPATVAALFKLVNLIAENMITEKRHVDELFEALPPNKRAGIEVRNKKALERPKGKD